MAALRASKNGTTKRGSRTPENTHVACARVDQPVLVVAVYVQNVRDWTIDSKATLAEYRLSLLTTKTKKQAVRPRFPAHYRPARVNTRVLGCPAQPAFLGPLVTQKTRPRKGSRASEPERNRFVSRQERSTIPAPASRPDSRLGSACANEPPIVPRLRICKSPMSRAASANNGWKMRESAACARPTAPRR